MNKKLLSLLFIIIFSLFLFGCGDDRSVDGILIDSDVNHHSEKALVLEATEVEYYEELEGSLMGVQYIKVKITSGEYKNQVYDIENYIMDNSIYEMVVEKGDKILVVIEDLEDGEIEVYLGDFLRQDYMMYLLVIFILLILLIGGKKGFKAVFTLSFTMFAILKILLPIILKGSNPIPATILIAIVITVVTIYLVSGINSKSTAAIIGTSGGVLLAWAIAYVVGNKVKLTGLSSEEAAMLMYIPQDIIFNFQNILFSGIILGSLGAVMDVGMSIASSIEEVYNANNDLTREELIKAGMNVGRDIMGTMTNTLILAYTGSSIPLLLLFMAYDTSLLEIINLEIVSAEIVRSLAGSIGLILTIPLTAIVTGFLIKRNRQGDRPTVLKMEEKK